MKEEINLYFSQIVKQEVIYYTHNYKLIIILNFNYTQFLRKKNLKHIYA